MSDWIKQQALRHEESKKSWNPWLHKVAEALKGFPWLTDVCCPSATATRHFDNPEDYFATTGDGLLGALFEVLSYEGDGRIRYVNLFEVAESYPGEYAQYKWEPGKAYPSGLGAAIHKRGVRHGDEMTFPELIAHILAAIDARKTRSLSHRFLQN